MNAEWLASLGAELKENAVELDKNIKSNLQLDHVDKPLLPEINDVAFANATSVRAKPLVVSVLRALERDYGSSLPLWFTTSEEIADTVMPMRQVASIVPLIDGEIS